MTSGMLKKILRVEEEAAAAELTAKIKAEEIIKEAKQKADAIILKARQQAEENTNTLVSQTKEGTDEIDKVATDAAKAEGATIVADARKKQAEAVKVMRSYLLPNFII